MSSHFVEEAKPKTRRSKGFRTWQFASGLQSKNLSRKQQYRKNKQYCQRKITEVELEKNCIHNNTTILGKFMVYDWGNGEDINYPNDNCMSIQHYMTIDSSKFRSCLVVDENKRTNRIFAKISRQSANYHLAHPKNIQSLIETSNNIIQSKPEVKRGTKCDSINTGYGIMGIRPDRNTPNNGPYAFKKTVSDERKRELQKETMKIVRHLQQSLGGIKYHVNREMSIMKQIVDGTSLTAIEDYAIAFSIGRDYHSKCHIDHDMFFTLATVVGPDSKSADDIIYYFVFPTYGKFGIKIPLRSGDTLLFNPSIPHSCSNPKTKGCFIMSAYVSKKTVLNSNVL